MVHTKVIVLFIRNLICIDRSDNRLFILELILGNPIHFLELPSVNNLQTILKNMQI